VRKDLDLRTLDRITQNCLKNSGTFICENSQGEYFCGVDPSIIPENVQFSCPYRTSTRIHFIDLGFTALGCDYDE
jgi:hypothetical protein